MSIVQNLVLAVKADATVGTSQSTGAAIPTSESTTTFGGSTNLWGTTWTYAEVNGSTFGVAIRISSTVSSVVSYYIWATGFGFSIPSSETIVGIAFSVKWFVTGNGTASAVTSVNYITATVYTATVSGLLKQRRRVLKG